MIMSSVHQDCFTSSTLTEIPFISFSHLLTPTRMFRAVSNTSVKSGQRYLVLDLRGKSFHLSLLSVLCRFPKNIPFVRLRKSLCIPLWLSVFIRSEC